MVYQWWAGCNRHKKGTHEDFLLCFVCWEEPAYCFYKHVFNIYLLCIVFSNVLCCLQHKLFITKTCWFLSSFYSSSFLGYSIFLIFFSGNHKLTQTAKVIIKICEHEVCVPQLIWLFYLYIRNIPLLIFLIEIMFSNVCITNYNLCRLSYVWGCISMAYRRILTRALLIIFSLGYSPYVI